MKLLSSILRQTQVVFSWAMFCCTPLAVMAVERPTIVTCEGAYPKHLQGVCGDGKEALFWSWTTALVKTDLTGKVLKKVSAPTHQGDLCHHDGKVYVAVNLGKFNEPPGKADSWVFVYDDQTLAELARHPVQEAVHGAGGMTWAGGRFYIVGGLPEGVTENYIYEYDEQMKFVRRHTLASGHTHKGIQTVAHADGVWWFGCYGSPKVLLRADKDLQFTGRWEFNGSYGIVPLPDGRFWVADDKNTPQGHVGHLRIANAHPEKGLILETLQP